MNTEAQTFANLDFATIIQRSLPQAQATIQNLTALAGAQHWSEAGQMLEGMPAFICGAGPSLARGDLQVASQTGVMLCPQTAAKALVSRECRIDAMAAIETADLSSVFTDVRDHVHSVWLDVSASAKIWNACVGLRGLVFHGLSPDAQWLTSALGFPPVEHGGSCVTALAQLAALLGADPIILVGCDLSYPTGKQYASGSEWDVDVVPDVDGWIRFAGGVDVKHAAIAKTFGDEPPVRRSVHKVRCNAGGEVITTGDYLQQLRWFEHMRKLWPNRRLWNCSIGGAHIVGWRHLELNQAIAQFPCQPEDLYSTRLDAVPAIGEDRAQQALGYLASVIEQNARVSDAIIIQSAPEHTPFWHDCSFVHALVAGDLAQYAEASRLSTWKQISAGTRARGLRAVWARGAVMALETLRSYK